MKRLEFRQNVPFNGDFGDFYCNSDDPKGESEFVFSSSVNSVSKSQIIVAECGFGFGRNFLSTLQICRKLKKKLHFVSIEKFPLSRAQLREIYANLGIFSNLSKKLIKKYPKFRRGLMRVEFASDAILDIYFGDVLEALNEFEFKADIWYLDGFSPAKNPEMWDKSVIKEIAHLAKKGTILRSYSVTAALKANLKEFGFEISVKSGFGKKREMLEAKFMGLDETFHHEKCFSRPFADLAAKKVLIIGAGISGILTALKLQNLGFDVIIAEKNRKCAGNASGNLIGALLPLVTQKGVNLGVMHTKAFFVARKFYKFLPRSLAKFDGAKLIAHNEITKNRYQNAEECFKFDEKLGGIWVKSAANLRPKKMCRHFAKSLKILYNHEFIDFRHENEGIEVKFNAQKSLKCDILIFAMGSESERLFGCKNAPLMQLDASMQISSVRGQATILRAFSHQKEVISAEGYICPKVGTLQLIGATYGRFDYEVKPRRIDDLKNIKSVAKFIKQKPKIIKSRVGFRSYSGDRFPIVGPLQDAQELKKRYFNLQFTKNNQAKMPQPAYLRNVYISAAHGSRGLGTAVLAGEILSDYILNRPFCVEKSLINAMQPSRFLIRNLKRGKKLSEI